MFNIARLLPREEKFYRFLEQLADLSLESALHLKTLVDSEDAAGRKAALDAIFASRLAAKKVSTDVTKELCLTFITPFDREDIQEFTKELYKIPKTIEKVANYLTLHNMTGIQELTAQVDLIIQESKAMQSMIATLIKGGKPEQIIEKAALLDTLENKGDEILSGLLVVLLRDTTDTRQLILRKDIYDMLERVIDRFRNAAGVALQMALKHS